MSGVRVLWLTKGLGRGGAETLLVSLARAMDRRDLTIEVAYQLPHKTALVASLEELGVRTRALGGGRRSWPSELRSLLHTGRHDIVHSHAPLVGSVARVVAPRGTVLLHTEHNVWARYHPATRAVNAATSWRNARIWAVSDQVAASIRPPRALPRPPVEVMLHGVDLATARRGPAAREAARERLGFAPETVLFGTVGNLAAKKDHDTMLRAFALVLRRLPEAHLVIVGTGPREQELKTLVRNLGIGEAVHLLGMRSDVPELLPGLDVFVLSSLHEGLAIAVIEAMAAGVPVVATGVGGIPQLIAGPEHGVLVPARDERGLAAAMAGLASDPGERRRLAAGGTARAAEFSIQPAADALAAHYRELCGPGVVRAS